jgi:hypothetical protein
MMALLKFLGLFLFAFSVQAEEPPKPAFPRPPGFYQNAYDVESQVYTKQSKGGVAALNKAAEVLRNPIKALPLPEKAEGIVDKMLGKEDSPSKEEPAPKKDSPRDDPTQMSANFRQELNKHSSSNSNSNTAKSNPENAIPAIELAAKIMGKNKSVMLRIKDRIVQIAEGDQLSLVENQQVLSIRVEKIDKSQVKIFISPLNKDLILQ